jgi:hypothetical protein
MAPVRSMLLDLIRGCDPSTAEIERHFKALKNSKAKTLPDGWQHWPSELRAMERDGLVKQESEIWVYIIPKPKPQQRAMF